MPALKRKEIGVERFESSGNQSAYVAQLAAQLICNQSVAGSIPVVGSTLRRGHTRERWTRSGAGDTMQV